jgi:hypothetical protein
MNRGKNRLSFFGFIILILISHLIILETKDYALG